MRTRSIPPALGSLALAGLLAAATTARAQLVAYEAKLTGASEVPPNDSKATGTVDATYDTVTKKFAFTITYQGLAGPVTAAHFHGPAAAGTNGGPELAISGSLASPIKGEATLTPAKAADLDKGLWYLNIHDSGHPTGELRGQLTKREAPLSSTR